MWGAVDIILRGVSLVVGRENLADTSQPQVLPDEQKDQ